MEYYVIMLFESYTKTMCFKNRRRCGQWGIFSLIFIIKKQPMIYLCLILNI